LQADAGVRYLAAQLNALGLKVRLEPVTVAHWVRGEESAALVDWPGRMAETTQKIVLTALGMSVATPEAGLTAPVVVVKHFDELKFLGESVRGKIVLYDVHFDERLEAAGYRFAGPVSHRNSVPSRRSCVRSVEPITIAAHGYLVRSRFGSRHRADRETRRPRVRAGAR
jgi:hypothetical protein